MRVRCCCDTRLIAVIRFIPPSWRPSPFQTSGDLEQWRTCLRALGIKLAVISVASFACKAALVALDFFGVLSGGGVYLGMSTLLVEALPSLLTIALLIRYHSGRIGDAQSSVSGMPLLNREARGHTAIDEAVVRETTDAWSTQATVDADSEVWLAQFMASGRVIGAAAWVTRANEHNDRATSFNTAAASRGPQ